ncbi:protein Ycf2-like [Helicoverpa zea]|uniref:protein Ycf2-like n=1 Tax=Helicoverpa zea TaxID=7113 RepID=UPI001F5A5249|nr:protein Ycf2-like [Helicoverpa zea]
METAANPESAEAPTATGDTDESKPPEEPDKGETGEVGENQEGVEAVEGGEVVEGVEGGETGEATATEEVDGEHVEGEGLEGEHVEGEFVEGEAVEGEQVEGEHVEGEEQEKVEGEEKEKVEGEEEEGLGEQVEAEETEDLAFVPEEEVEEEQQYVEEPPPDPAAPYGFSDSKEALKAPFSLRPDQLAEVEQLWEIYQNYTPAYADLDGFITEKELVYMLKSLLLMTYTVEQLQELVAYCCRPPHAKGHIFYDQFLKMVTIRQRDFPIEEEIRSALQFFDPEKTGIIDREYLKEILSKQGSKMGARQLDNLIKEVDMSNDGTIGIEDVVGTMCIDLNKEDLQLLRAAVYPPTEDIGGERTEEAPVAVPDDDEEDD